MDDAFAIYVDEPSGVLYGLDVNADELVVKLKYIALHPPDPSKDQYRSKVKW